MDYGDIPHSVPDVPGQGIHFEATPGRFLLQVDGIGRFLVRDGREIMIDRHPAASDDEVRLFLLGSAMGATDAPAQDPGHARQFDQGG